MKIHISGDRLTINLRTDDNGGSAYKLLDTQNTEVYYGTLHARVTLKDLGIEVEMDPMKGSWDYEKWARAKTFEAITPHVQEWLPKLLALHLALGVTEGRRSIRNEFHALMGIERHDPFSELR